MKRTRSKLWVIAESFNEKIIVKIEEKKVCFLLNPKIAKYEPQPERKGKQK